MRRFVIGLWAVLYLAATGAAVTLSTGAMITACTRQDAQKALNVADVVCAIDAIDPALPPEEVQAAIAKACGASPDIHKIVDAHKLAVARTLVATGRAIAVASAASSSSAASSAPPPAPAASSAAPTTCAASSASASAAPSASVAPKGKKK